MALEDFRAEVERCSNCSYCKWIPLDKIKSNRFASGCPAISYNNFNAYSARGRYAVSLSLLEGDSPYTDKLTDIVTSCMACGSCDVSCKVCRYNLEPLEHNIELKAELVRNGHILPRQKAMIDSLGKEGTMMPGMVRKYRRKWSDGLNVKDALKEKTEVLFFVGCRYSYDEKLWNIPRTVVNVLASAGVDIGIMADEETCCGSRASQMGFREESAYCARKNIQKWETAGIKTVVTSCSDCYHAFKRLYPKLGNKVEVLHTVELIDRLIKDGTIKFSKTVPMTVTYHDPCHLGRQGEPYIPWEGKEKKIRNQIHTWEPAKPRYNGAYGIYEAPRDVLKSIPGLQLVEMERIREYAWCCGAGAGNNNTNPAYSAWTAKERIEEANTTGAEAIVTACPWCERNFINASTGEGDNIKVFDIIDLVQQAI